MGDQLVTAADHLQLARLVTEISWRIDHGKADTVHELFVDEGTMTLGPTTLSGREQIREWGRQRAGATYRTRHVCTNMRFVADGDDAAEGTTVITQYRGEDDGAGHGSTPQRRSALAAPGGHAGRGRREARRQTSPRRRARIPSPPLAGHRSCCRARAEARTAVGNGRIAVVNRMPRLIQRKPRFTRRSLANRLWWLSHRTPM
jgi:hypothetical protein